VLYNWAILIFSTGDGIDLS